jgi:phospholipid-binding lipoprotein MlaA
LPGIAPIALPTAAIVPAAVEQPAAVQPIALPPLVVLPDLAIPPEPQTIPPAEQAGDGTVVVTGRSRRGDPLAPVNAASFEATQAIDDVLVGPLSRAYTAVLPTPARDGVRNFLGNLREPIVFANYLLQLKPGKAMETLGRFAINTTVGVAGLFDVAKRKPFRLPRRRNSFANTLGLYGVKPGPFFFLPLVGPTTLRDLFGTTIDQLMVPVSSLPPLNDRNAALAISGFSALSYRADLDPTLKAARATADPYAARRKAYLDRREAEIDAIRGRKLRSEPPLLPMPLRPLTPVN